MEFECAITEIAHRANSKYVPAIRNSGPLPTIQNGGKLATVFIGLDGVSSVLDCMWYLIWGELTKESVDSVSSPLCEESPSDPCLFPPFSLSFNFFSIEWLSVQLVTWPLGFYSSFTVQAVVPPPSIGFSDGAVDLTASASAVLLGVGFGASREPTVLAEFTTTLDIDATDPEFIPSLTGGNKLGGLELTDINIMDTAVNILGDGVFSFLIKRQQLIATVEGVLSDVLDLFLPLANTYIPQGLEELPLDIPRISNFPTDGSFFLRSLYGSGYGCCCRQR